MFTPIANIPSYSNVKFQVLKENIQKEKTNFSNFIIYIHNVKHFQYISFKLHIFEYFSNVATSV